MFLEACRHWQRHGAEVLDEVRRDSPAKYLSFMARILPRNLALDVSSQPRKSLKEMSNQEILQWVEPDVLVARVAAGCRTRKELLAPIDLDELKMLSEMNLSEVDS
jgi:hypothetical protein